MQYNDLTDKIPRSWFVFIFILVKMHSAIVSLEIEAVLSHPGTDNHWQDPQNPKTNMNVIHWFSLYVFQRMGGGGVGLEGDRSYDFTFFWISKSCKILTSVPFLINNRPSLTTPHPLALTTLNLCQH